MFNRGELPRNSKQSGDNHQLKGNEQLTGHFEARLFHKVSVVMHFRDRSAAQQKAETTRIRWTEMEIQEAFRQNTVYGDLKCLYLYFMFTDRQSHFILAGGYCPKFYAHINITSAVWDRFSSVQFSGR